MGYRQRNRLAATLLKGFFGCLLYLSYIINKLDGSTVPYGDKTATEIKGFIQKD